MNSFPLMYFFSLALIDDIIPVLPYYGHGSPNE
jgi:hypothetical protein